MLKRIKQFKPIFAFFKLRHGTRTPRGSFDLLRYLFMLALMLMIRSGAPQYWELP
jgi:hypothetical protein